MSVEFVKTADLNGRLQRDAFGQARWAFCSECYGNTMTEGKTTQADGKVCERCDGAGALWIVEAVEHP